MEDIDGVYRWVGPPVSDDTKRTYYPAVLVQYKTRGKSKNNHLCLFKLGFQVLVHNGEQIPHIAEIEELYQDKERRKMMVKLRWFYRYRDAKQHHKFPISPHAREIFFSSHSDENEVVVIKAPCYVLFLKEKQLIPLWENHNHNSFICRYELKFPGILPITAEKIQKEMTQNFKIFPSQLQHILLSDTSFQNFSIPIVGPTESIFNKTSSLASSINEQIPITTTQPSVDTVSTNLDVDDGCHPIQLLANTNNSLERGNLVEDENEEDLYFSSRIPPTVHLSVPLLDFANPLSAVRSPPITTTDSEEKNESDTDYSEYFHVDYQVGQLSSKRNNPESFQGTLLKRQRITEPETEEEYFFEEERSLRHPERSPKHDKLATSTKLASDLSPSVYLFSSPRQSLTSSPGRLTSTRSVKGVTSMNAGVDQSDAIEDRYIENAASHIPSFVPKESSDIHLCYEDTSIKVWQPSDDNNDLTVFANLEVYVQFVIQRLLNQSLKQYQNAKVQSSSAASSDSSMKRLVVDGATAMIVGIDVYGLFHECFHLCRCASDNDNCNIWEVFESALCSFEERLVNHVSIWSLQEQETLYALCRTPEKKTHIISLPILRAQRELHKKSVVEIIEFFEKYIDNGRYLDLVIPHEGFAYELIHSDMCLEDGLALLPQSEGGKAYSINPNNNDQTSKRSAGGGSARVTKPVYSLSDTIASLEDEHLRRSIFWAQEDNELYGIDSQQEYYGGSFAILDQLIVCSSTKQKTLETSKDIVLQLPHLSLKQLESDAKLSGDFDRKNTADEKMCQKFFYSLADILDEVSFHQICCAILLWQRTIITMGGLVVRVSHVLAEASILKEQHLKFDERFALSNQKESLRLKRDLYAQFRYLVDSNGLFHNFQLPFFEL